jgi:hypothetical protein
MGSGFAASPRPGMTKNYLPQFQAAPIGVQLQHGPKLPPL